MQYNILLDLTADAVCKELEDLVQDWFQLGYMFLSNSQRVREAGTGDSNKEKRRNVIGYWLKSDPIASWELVARRIEDCFPQHEPLAEEIRQKYLPKVDTTPLIRPPTPGNANHCNTVYYLSILLKCYRT